MKNKIYYILFFLIIFSPVSGEEKIEEKNICNTPDAITPSSATVFLEIMNISRTIELLNTNNEYNNLVNLLFNYKARILEFKNKTGIDLSSKESLKRAGFDTDRSVYIALIKNTKNPDETVSFIPVINTKKIPLSFVKLLKNLKNNDTNLDLNPAVSKYNNFRVYQIQPNIFYTLLNGYFILTQSGESLKAIIDLHSKGCDSSLSADPFFIDYKNKSGFDNSNLISIFIKKDFLHEKLEKTQRKNNKEKFSDNTSTKAENTSENNTENDLNNSNPETDEISNSYPVNYISLNLKGSPDNISTTIMISTDKENPSARLLADIVTTGMTGKAISADSMIGYYFLSFDFNKLNNYCKEFPGENENICKSLKRILRYISRKGIQLKNMTFPCSKSFINVILKKSNSIGEMDNFIIYIPMKECGEIEDMMENIKDNLEKIYMEDSFGEEKINEIDSFWFITKDNNKINMLEYDNDIYIGNNIDLIKNAVKSPNINIKNIKDDFFKGMDSNTFLFSNNKFDDESFLKALLMMMAFKERPELFSLISKIKSISLTGKKIDHDYNFDLKIKMISEKNN